ncbi:MAG: RNA polymerase sigma factor [Actinomycetota bacterium]
MATKSEDIAVAGDWFEQYGDDMRARALAKVGADNADDSVQDVFLKLLDRGDLGTIEAPERYMTRAHSHQMAEHWRDPHRAEVPFEDREDTEAFSSEPGALFESQEDLALLRKCLGSLKSRQRAVAEMKLEGRGGDEIAAFLQISFHAVTQLSKRMQENLRRHLLKNGYIHSLVIMAAGLRLRSRHSLQRFLQWRPVLEPFVVSAVVATMIAGGSLLPGTPTSVGKHGLEATRISDPAQGRFTDATSIGASTSSTQTRSDMASDAPAARQTVAAARIGQTETKLEEQSNEGEPEAGLEQQVEGAVKNPSSLLPQCGGLVNCP